MTPPPVDRKSHVGTANRSGRGRLPPCANTEPEVSAIPHTTMAIRIRGRHICVSYRGPARSLFLLLCDKIAVGREGAQRFLARRIEKNKDGTGSQLTTNLITARDVTVTGDGPTGRPSRLGRLRGSSMIDDVTADEQRTKTSPWPIFIALGVALSEVGVLFGIRPVSVVGLLLLVGSVAGILHESGYITHPDRAVGVQGVALIGIGLALVAVNQAGSTVRGQSIAIAGTISLFVVSFRQLYTRV